MISHKNKFVFIHIPKTGGSSIKHQLNAYADPPSHNSHGFLYHTRPTAYELENFHKKWLNHCPSVLSELIYPEEEYFKFTFVRNPWDRLVSYYFHSRATWTKKHARKQASFKNWILGATLTSNNADKQHSSFDSRPRTTNTNQCPCPHDTFKSTISAHPQLDWVLDQNQKNTLDFIGRFERLHRDFERVCKRIGVVHPNKLQHRKKTNHKHYSKYYTEETIEVVASWYKKDIDYFEYKFGE